MRISDWSSDVCSSDLDGGLSYSLFGDPSLPFSDDRNNFTSIDQNRSATGVYFQSTLARTDALKLTGGLSFNKDEAGLETSWVGTMFTFFGPHICRFPPTSLGGDFAHWLRNITDHYDARNYKSSLAYLLKRKV